MTKQAFNKAAFDVEHALNIYAEGFCTIPAEAIYDSEALTPYLPVIDTCHIYLIGFTPSISVLDWTQVGDTLEMKFGILGNVHSLSLEIPPGLTLKSNGIRNYFEDRDGKKTVPDQADLQRRLSSELGVVQFEVKYIGQAYGQDGSRTAIDRLLKHETLQKIALKGVPAGHKISLLLLSLSPATRMVTMFNPFAKNTSDGSQRIDSGLEKMNATSEAERVSVFEAALIRYFYPEFNTIFKDSFPSTNLKILQDCYDKDFNSVIAEISIDDLPFRLFSQTVPPSYDHLAHFDLHIEEDRKVFFGFTNLPHMGSLHAHSAASNPSTSEDGK